MGTSSSQPSQEHTGAQRACQAIRAIGSSRSSDEAAQLVVAPKPRCERSSMGLCAAAVP